MSTPSISVIMAAFNAAPHIGEAIASLSRQSRPDWELIVADDRSTDDTCERVLAVAAVDPRVRLIRLERNAGPAAARNAALDAARGAWITVLDADDRYQPDRLATLLARACADDLDLIADNLLLVDPDSGRVVSKGFRLPAEPFALTPAGLARNDGPPRLTSLGHLKPFLRADFLKATGQRYPANLRIGEDFWLLYRLVERTSKARLVDYAGYVYTLPFGLRSGRATASSRTSYGARGVDELGRANALLRDEAAASDSALARAFERRAANIADEHIWREVRACVHAGRYLEAARGLARMDIRSSAAQVSAALRRRLGRLETRIG